MGNIPVLKPNEVIAILIKLGFTEVANADHTNSSAIPMVVVQRFRFIKAATFLRSFYARSPKTSA